MNAKGGLAVVLIAAAFLGCDGLPQTVTAPAPKLANAEVPANTDTVYIADPSFRGMNAFEVTIPAKWHFESGLYPMAGYVVYQKDNCVAEMPSGVYRATSPDGLSFAEQMPVPVWGWASGPSAAVYDMSSCFPLHGPTSAQDFLKYLSASLGVEYVGAEPVPAAENAKAQNALRAVVALSADKYAAAHMQGPKSTRQLARAIVRYRNGTFLMKGRLSVTLDCVERTNDRMKPTSAKKPQPAPTIIDTCAPSVVYLVAPASQYDGLVKQWDRTGPGVQDMGARRLDPWAQAWLKRRRDELEMNLSAGKMFILNEEMLSWQNKVARSQAARRQMFERFDQAVKQGLAKAPVYSAEMANQNHTIAPDWVDYALDEDMWINPETEKLNKAPSSYTWMDSSGKMNYQTYDAKANPNGVLPGNWTRAQAMPTDEANKK